MSLTGGISARVDLMEVMPRSLLTGLTTNLTAHTHSTGDVCGDLSPAPVSYHPGTETRRHPFHTRPLGGPRVSVRHRAAAPRDGAQISPPSSPGPVTPHPPDPRRVARDLPTDLTRGNQPSPPSHPGHVLNDSCEVPPGPPRGGLSPEPDPGPGGLAGDRPPTAARRHIRPHAVPEVGLTCPGEVSGEVSPAVKYTRIGRGWESTGRRCMVSTGLVMRRSGVRGRVVLGDPGGAGCPHARVGRTAADIEPAAPAGSSCSGEGGYLL